MEKTVLIIALVLLVAAPALAQRPTPTNEVTPEVTPPSSPLVAVVEVGEMEAKGKGNRSLLLLVAVLFLAVVVLMVEAL
jgi:hypothetical protein